MSSGIRPEYTEKEKAGLFAQFASAMKIGHDQQRPAARISEVLQFGIIQDTHDVQMIPKIIQTPTGNIFHVTGDKRSAVEIFTALDCKVKWGLAETPAKIPMTIQPVDCNVRAVPLGKTRTTEQLYQIPNIVSPAELFYFGAKFPEEQREAPIVTVWLDAGGQFWYAILSVGGDERGVIVDRFHPGGGFDGGCRVLVRES